MLILNKYKELSLMIKKYSVAKFLYKKKIKNISKQKAEIKKKKDL